LDGGIGAPVYERASWLETRHIFAGSESPRLNGLKKAMPRAEGREMMSWCARTPDSTGKCLIQNGQIFEIFIRQILAQVAKIYPAFA